MDEHAGGEKHPDRINSVSVGDLLDDLERLGEVSGKCYGYVSDDMGGILVEVYNDDWHGVKALYQVEVTLTPIEVMGNG